MIILSTQLGADACSNYRIRRPLSGLEKLGDTIHIFDDKKDSVNDLVKSLPHFDYIFMRPGAELFMFKVKSIPELSKIKAKWVLDIDDNVDLISPYSQFYADYGLKPYKHGDVDVWVDGKNGFSIENNLKRLNSLKTGMRSVDLITVTTGKLAEHARKYNKNVYVNDNTLDLDHWWRLSKTENKPLRVVWQGSPSHYEDWYAIKEPLTKLMDEYDFEMIMLGSQYKGIFEERHLNRVKALPWIPFEAHSYRMMSLQADIGIIPLADLPFNEYKSAIKWYENAAMGLPSVVSNIKPYSDVISNDTALGYKTSDEFYKQMKRLLENADLRAKIADKAYNWVIKNKSLETESKKLHDFLSSELDRRVNGSNS